MLTGNLEATPAAAAAAAAAELVKRAHARREIGIVCDGADSHSSVFILKADKSIVRAQRVVFKNRIFV